MIQTLSENVIVPIAGLVITYVLCYELISMVTEKNNMHDIDTFMFFKWFFKAFVAVFLVTNTFNITMAVFDMAQHIVSGAAGVIGGDTNIDVAEALAAMQEGLEDMEIPELLLLVLGNKPCEPLHENHVRTDNRYPIRQNDRDLPLLFGIAYPICNHDQQRMGTDWEQLPKRAVRSWFSRLPHYDMRRHLCGFGRRYDISGQPAQRDIFPCSLYRYPLFLPVQIRRTGKIHIQRPLRAERRFFLGVCTCTQRLIQSQNKSRFQSDKAANRLFCGGSLMGLPLFFLLKDSAGTSLAAMAMIVVMLPCFLLAMYEKHGQPLEVVVKNIIQTKFTRPKERPYQNGKPIRCLGKAAKLRKGGISDCQKDKQKRRGKPQETGVS